MLSWSGSSLNELNENETLVISMVCVWGTPTVKSYHHRVKERKRTLKMILSGFEMKEIPLNSRPATIWGLVMPSFCLCRAFSMYSCSRMLSFGTYS